MSFKMNEHHWMVLIDFMESHLSFARGQFSGPTGKMNQRKLWVDLTQRLNSLGYGERTTEKWQKTWADIKYLLKKKASAIKKDISMTGGGTGSQCKLTSYEERIVGILGKSFTEGVGSTECGLNINTLQKTHVQTYVPLAFEQNSVPSITEVVTADAVGKTASCSMSSNKFQRAQIPVTSTITQGLMTHNLLRPVTSATVIHEESGDELNTNYLNRTIIVDDTPQYSVGNTEGSNSNILTAKGIKQKGVPTDHIYCAQSKRKKTTEEVEKELYQETIEELREIKRGVYNISDHMQSISETLKDIRNIMNQKQGDISFE